MIKKSEQLELIVSRNETINNELNTRVIETEASLKGLSKSVAYASQLFDDFTYTIQEFSADSRTFSCKNVKINGPKKLQYTDVISYGSRDITLRSGDPGDIWRQGSRLR